MRTRSKGSIPGIFTNLTFWVAVALVTAILLGYYYPALAVRTKWMGDDFVFLIKVFIPFIIFFTIVSGISGMSDLKKVGRIGVKSLLYFEVVTTLSLAIGILLAYINQPGRIGKTGLPIGDVSKYTRQGAASFSWSDFFLSNLTLQVLLLSIIVGIIISFHSRRERIIARLAPATRFVFMLLK